LEQKGVEKLKIVVNIPKGSSNRSANLSDQKIKCQSWS